MCRRLRWGFYCGTQLYADMFELATSHCSTTRFDYLQHGRGENYTGFLDIADEDTSMFLQSRQILHVVTS